MKMLELYKELLSVGSLKADEEALVSAVMDGNVAPLMVEGKRLVLPTPEHQAGVGTRDIVLFHPLQENVLRGESKVMEKFRSTINIRMNYVLQMVAQELLGVGVNVEAHKRLNPDQAILLTALKDADEKSMTALQALIKAMGLGNSERCIVHIYLKRGGQVKGRKYPRAAIVTFPLYEELCKEDKHVYGVSISKKAKAVLRALFEFILPGIGEVNHYDVGSESDIAPFLDSLMRAVMKLAGAINTVVDNYENFIDRAANYRYSDDWVETFDNLGQLLGEIRAVPMQAGNEGSIAKTPNNTANVVAQQLQNVTPAPVNPTQPHAIPMQPMQQPVQQWAPMQQQPLPGAPAVVMGANGIDMSATLMRNPQTAAMMSMAAQQAGYMVPMAMPAGPVGARMNEPRWAAPQPMMMPGYGQPMMMAPMPMAPMGGGVVGRF